MKMYHITHKDNLLSILNEGLIPSYSQGKHKVIWLCTSRQVPYMVGYISRWKRCESYELITLKVFIQRIYMQRQRDGTWYTAHKIDSSNIDLL